MTTSVGCGVGADEGRGVGLLVGDGVTTSVGSEVGDGVTTLVGSGVGDGVTTSVGCGVGGGVAGGAAIKRQSPFLPLPTHSQSGVLLQHLRLLQMGQASCRERWSRMPSTPKVELSSAKEAAVVLLFTAAQVLPKKEVARSKRMVLRWMVIVVMVVIHDVLLHVKELPYCVIYTVATLVGLGLCVYVRGHQSSVVCACELQRQVILLDKLYNVT